MFTGASTADVAVVLIDARTGVVTQTRRHAHIAALLGIEHVVVCVNKMDLVGWDPARFAEIVAAGPATSPAACGIAGSRSSSRSVRCTATTSRCGRAHARSTTGRTLLEIPRRGRRAGRSRSRSPARCRSSGSAGPRDGDSRLYAGRIVAGTLARRRRGRGAARRASRPRSPTSTRSTPRFEEAVPPMSVTVRAGRSSSTSGAATCWSRPPISRPPRGSSTARSAG